MDIKPVDLDFNQLSKKITEWLEWEIEEKGDHFCPADRGTIDHELFVICAQQGKTFPSGTIWNEDYFWDNSERIDRWLEWVDTNRDVQKAG